MKLEQLKFRTRIICMTLMAAAPLLVNAQTVPADSVATRGWYAGIQAGTALGQCTFRSITEHDTRLGFQGGAFVGYEFSRVLSAEVSAVIGSQKQSACDCCPYWLGENGVRHYASQGYKSGWYYSDLTASTTWQRFGLQANVDLLPLFIKRGTRWSVRVSPQLSAVHTGTELRDPQDRAVTVSWADASQWHLGLGGQLSAGYAVSRRVGLSVYGGMTSLSGDRFDLLPEHGHRSNLIFDAGIRLVYHINR